MPTDETAFSFKYFAVRHDQCAMKVGTDSVLLGAWTDTGNALTILDVGAGTGVLALMMAQKCDALIEGLDINESAFLQAKDNFSESRWHERLKVYHVSLQDFVSWADMKYDLIISNPPFFIDASKAGSNARNIARHINESLTFEELAEGVITLLKPEGRFCVILPVKEGNLFIEICEKKGLFYNRITRVRTKADKHEKRLLLEMSFKRKNIVSDELVIHNEDGGYSKEFMELTKDFYTHYPVRNLQETPAPKLEE